MTSSAVRGGLVALVVSVLLSTSDATVKFLSGSYSAPQIFAISCGFTVVVTLLLAARRNPGRGLGAALVTSCPWAMALRSLVTVMALLGYFFAFRDLPFAEVYLFIGMSAVFAALLSWPILRDPVGPATVAALLLGIAGIFWLFPTGLSAISFGHVMALTGAVGSALSLVLSRYISRHERATAAQVFYPNLASFVVMAVALPAVWLPMSLGDLALVLVYSGLFLVGRWLIVAALRSISAHALSAILEIQFVWMVAIGALWFDEWPHRGVFIGAAMVIVSGFILLLRERPAPAAAPRAARVLPG